MEEKIREKKNFVDNVAYKSKFQFRIWINDNIICQRYFKINGFNEDSIHTEEFNYCMNSIVRSIQEDLESKSRIWQWYTNMSEPLKSQGFVNEGELSEYDVNFLRLLVNSKVIGDVQAPNGKTFRKEYIDYGVIDKEFNTEVERPADNEFVFKFSFLIDDVPVFEKIWDGNVYPKYVRNGVDLTNSFGDVTNEGISSLSFGSAIVRYVQRGKINLISDFIRRICDTLSNTFSDKYEYTKEMGEFGTNYDIDKEKYENAVKYYGVVKPEVTGHIDIPVETKKYDYSYEQSSFEEYKKNWRKATSKKTYEYIGSWYENLSPRQIDYIDKHY